MTAPLSKIEAALDAPVGGAGGMVTDMSARQRLSMQMRLASEADPTKVGDPGQWSSQTLGLPNPHGRGLAAFEPNNILFQGYGSAKGESDASKAQADAIAAEQQKITVGPQPGQIIGDGTGKVGAFVQAALSAATRKIPYVWGGTSLSTGTDCSGLVYAAAKAAGLNLPRYRAVDYLQLGQQEDAKTAMPGDVVVYDEGGGNGHIGIYLGNGMMVASPQTGDHVRVQKVYGKPTAYRRLFTDNSMQQVVTSTGSTGFSYNGMSYNPSRAVPGSTMPILENPALQRQALARYSHNI